MSSLVLEYIAKAANDGELDDLNLNDMPIPKITPPLKRKIESLSTILVLSLNNCKLQSLANFPTLPDLTRLELIDNPFPTSDLAHLSHLDNLQSLSLAGCRIANISDLEPLKGLKELIQLDLSGTSLAAKDTYRADVFKLLASLQILDNMDSEGNEVDYSDSDGEGDTESEEGYDNDEGLEEDDEGVYDEEDEDDYEDEDDDDEEEDNDDDEEKDNDDDDGEDDSGDMKKLKTK